MSGHGYVHLLNKDGDVLVRSKNTIVKEEPLTVFDVPYLDDNTRKQVEKAIASQEPVYGSFSMKENSAIFIFIRPKSMVGICFVPTGCGDLRHHLAGSSLWLDVCSLRF